MWTLFTVQTVYGFYLRHYTLLALPTRQRLFYIYYSFFCSILYKYRWHDAIVHDQISLPWLCTSIKTNRDSIVHKCWTRHAGVFFPLSITDAGLGLLDAGRRTSHLIFAWDDQYIGIFVIYVFFSLSLTYPCPYDMYFHIFPSTRRPTSWNTK